jgi:hypothetical protein
MLSNTTLNLLPPLFSIPPTEANTENINSQQIIDIEYQLASELRLDLKNLNGLSSRMNKTSSKNYLVKIDDDYKLVTECYHLNSEQLEKIISTYYTSNEIEIFPVANNVNLLSSYICSSNSFLKNNEIDPKIFIEYFNKFDEIINYINILDSSNKFVKTFQNIGKSVDNISQQLKSVEKNNSNCLKSIINTNMFDTTGTYINDNTCNIEGLLPYSKEMFGDVDNGNYEFEPSGSYMNLENFEESLLDYHKDYTIYFNNQFNNVIIIESKSDFIGSNNKLKKLFQEIIFVTKERLSKETYIEVSKLSQDVFVNVDDVKTKLNKILHDKVINSKLSIDEIKFLIKKYFSIDTNHEHCVKFTNIWDIISSELKVSESFVNYTKRQLPLILQDLGLNKKRLSDGIYWYGLVCKPLDTTKPLTSFINNVVEDEPIPVEQFKSIFDKYLTNRDSDLKSAVLSYPTSLSQPIKNEQVNPIEMGSIIEFVNQIEICTNNEKLTSNTVESEKITVKKHGNKKSNKDSNVKIPKIPKIKNQKNKIVESESVSNELGKLITKSE